MHMNRAILLSIIFLFFLSACGGSSNSSKSGFKELLLVSDGPTLKSLSVSGSTATERGSATMAIPGTYTRAGNTVTVTTTNHDLSVGSSIELNFNAGTGGTATDGIYLVASVVDDNNYTVIDSTAGDITDGTLTRAATTTLSGTYTQTDTTVTITIPDHGIPNQSSISLVFITGDAIDTTSFVEAVADSNTFTVEVTNSATTNGDISVTYMENYTQFFAALHPSGDWVYTSSTFNCSNGVPHCWGNGYINRYAINWKNGKLSYEKSFYAQVDEDANDENAPTGLTFSEDGSLLFLHDDDLDGIVMWSVDVDGELTFLAATENAYLHGLALNSDNTRLYNGDNVFTIDTVTPSISRTSNGLLDGCNSNILNSGYLYCADDNVSDWEVRVFDVATDPENPTEIDSFETAENEVRELALTTNGFVTSGWCGLRSYSFDGSTIEASADDGSNEYIGCNGTFQTSGKREMYRTLSVNNAGNKIATAYFTNNPQDGAPPSGFKLLSIDDNGALSLLADYPDNYFSRIAKFIQKP